MGGTRDLVLVTGAAGRVAEHVLPSLRTAFRLRRLDLVEQPAEGDDEVVQADVRDDAAVEEAADGVAAIVHLAAQPDEADFRSLLLPRNVDGTWAVFEAAARGRVPRVVFASSVQVVAGYPEHVRIAPDAAPRPVSTYGCTKAFGEALARYHADVSGIGAACLRIGAVMAPDDPRLGPGGEHAGFWCGPDDLARLFVAAVRSDAPFATVNAVSPPATDRFDPANPFGWQPLETPAAVPAAPVARSGSYSEEARAILAEYGIAFPSWQRDGRLARLPDEARVPVAWALATIWRHDRGGPGFAQPPQELWAEVEQVIGEPIV